jgi:serine/threonine-protein kinase
MATIPDFSSAFSEAFEVRSLLGEGGMGRVYLARDRKLDRPVAIKFLAAVVDDAQRQFRERFHEEARVCASLKHPNIVRLYSDGWEGEAPYLVFEFVEGRDLARELQLRRTLSVDETLSLTEDVLGGLQEAHGLGVVHRDIKPANIIIRADGGGAMLMDFGVAKTERREAFKTAASVILGTPAYMAPEVIRGGRVTPSADLYSLGCMLFECLAGVPPLVGRSEILTLDMQINETPRPLDVVRTDVPAAVSQFVMRALAKDPAERYESAQEMCDTLVKLRVDGRISGPRIRLRPSSPGLAVKADGDPSVRETGGGGAAAATAAAAVATEAPGVAQAAATRRETRSRPDPPSRPRAAAPSDPGVRRPQPTPRSRPGGSGTVIVAGPAVAPTAGRDRRTLSDWIILDRLDARRAIRMAGVLLATCMLGGIAISRWLLSDTVRNVKIVASSDILEVSWETRLASPGRVLAHRLDQAEPTPDPRKVSEILDGRRPSEKGPDDGGTEHHTVRVRGLVPDSSYLVVIGLGGDTDRAGWAGCVATPPRVNARVLPGGGDIGQCTVGLAAGQGSRGELIVERKDVVTFRTRPTAVRGDTLLFTIPESAGTLDGQVYVDIEQTPGVVARYPVRTVRDVARALAEALESEDPAAIIADLVRRPEFDNNLDLAVIGRMAFLPSRGAPAEQIRRRAPVGTFLGLIRQKLSPRALALLEEFRPHAGSFFTAREDGGRELQLRLYHVLLRYRWLDVLVASQHDDQSLGIRSLHRDLVSHRYRLLEPGAERGVEPGERDVIREPLAWIMPHFASWDTLLPWLRDHTPFARLFPGVDMKEDARVKEAFRSDLRLDGVRIPPAGRSRELHLRALVCFLAPAYALEVALEGADERRSIRLLLTHPATGDWFRAMDDVGAAGDLFPDTAAPTSAGRKERRSRTGWGEIRTVIPHDYLPGDRLRVNVTYRRLPGPPGMSVSAIDRTAYVRKIALSAP